MRKQRLETRCFYVKKVEVEIGQGQTREYFICVKRKLDIEHPRAERVCVHQAFFYITDPEQPEKQFPQCRKYND